MGIIKSIYYQTSTTWHPVYGKRSILYNDGVAQDAYAFSIAEFQEHPRGHRIHSFRNLMSRALFRVITWVLFSIYFFGDRVVRIFAR